MFTVGVFLDAAWAGRGLAALLGDGFTADTVSVVAKPSPEVDALIRSSLGVTPATVSLFDLGEVEVHGALAGVLASGPASGRVASAFGRAGFQRHDGHIYQTLVARGGVLVAIESEPRAADALALLHAYGAGNAAIGAWAGRV
jgi:hypothetical protein